MERRISVFASVILLALIACQLFSGLGGSPKPAPDTAQQPAAAGDSGYFTRPGNPIDLTLSLDTTGVTGVIPMSGGALSATGSDGTRYTLTVPPDALQSDTEISMTPISSIMNLPFSGGLGGAVKLEPSGLTFDNFVTLKIEPANPIPVENQVMFGFEGDGEDLHLALPVVDSQDIQILLLNFSGVGVANGISADKAGVLQRMADRAEIRLMNQMADYLSRERQRQLLGVPEEGDLTAAGNFSDEFFNSVVSPRIKAAVSPSGTCADAQKALQTYLSWERQRQLLGIPEEGEKFGGLVNDFVPIMAKKCFDEEFDRCANKHMIAGMLPALLQYERMGQLLGVLDPYNPGQENNAWAEARTYGENLAKKCFQWDLEFESAGTYTIKSGISYDSRVKAKVPIRMEGQGLTMLIEGKSALNNVDFTFSVPGCRVTSNRGGGEFTVNSLTWETVLRKDSDGEMRYFVKDFYLKYFPGKTSETMTIKCDSAGGMTTPPGSLWTALFIVTHAKEVEPGADGGQAQAIDPAAMLAGGVPADAKVPAYLAKYWMVNTNELMATKEWQGTSEIAPEVFEGGEFKLNHRPQK